MKTGLIRLIQEDKHPAPPGHPETAGRMSYAVDELLKSDLAGKPDILTPETVDTEAITRVHDPAYLDYAKNASQKGGYLDSDTYISTTGFDAAMETASASIYAVEKIMDGDRDNIFLAGRPPGHHAEYDRGMGFCIINNTAVAAEQLIHKHKLARVAIVDWDVHHGNGTQRIFYDRKDVFYISLHRFPFYPGSGATSEVGTGEGEGYTLNIPLPAGTGDDEFMTQFDNKVIPALNAYKPRFIIIGAGFDAHADDPLGGMNLTENVFGEMTAALVRVADKYCDGRILSLFEGGYDPDANARCLYRHMKELVG
jgi:acetoin utilization deacetylase AcuC-like enzyme